MSTPRICAFPDAETQISELKQLEDIETRISRDGETAVLRELFGNVSVLMLVLGPPTPTARCSVKEKPVG